ncbi:MAG TPA: cache domain-containing protein [Bryobacteraceae bacterium]|nr:cache domain-containing protein [Bryobacteraceae bacterium]
MPMEERLEFRVSFQKLLLGLMFTIVPVSLAGLYAITHTYRSLEATIGGHFKVIAESTAAATHQFITERILDVGEMTVEPAIVDAVVASNRSWEGMPDAAVAAKIEKIDKAWNTPAADPIVRAMLSSRASRLLRRYHDLDSRILRITVTDAKGVAVAASHKTLDYYQADEEYWQNIYAQGRGAVSLTDILYDEATKSNYIGIGLPIMEEGTNRFIGTLDALVDVTTVFPVINRLQLGPTARTLLVKEDGTVISAPQVDLAMKLKSGEYAAVQEALGTVHGRERGYIVAELPNVGQTLIGFADTGLKRDFRNLAWLVLVCQSTREAFAPVRVVERLIGFTSVLGLAMVTFAAAYFSLHRKRTFTEIDELRAGTPSQAESKPETVR